MIHVQSFGSGLTPTGLTTQAVVACMERLLGEFTLDPTFEQHGDFIDGPSQGEQLVRFFGNFMDYSHVFQFATDEQWAIDRLYDLIRGHQQSARYLRLKGMDSAGAWEKWADEQEAEAAWDRSVGLELSAPGQAPGDVRARMGRETARGLRAARG